MNFEIFNNVCLFLAFLFSCWSSAVALTINPDHVPLENLGRTIILTSGFIVGTASAFLLVYKIAEVLNAAT